MKPLPSRTGRHAATALLGALVLGAGATGAAASASAHRRPRHAARPGALVMSFGDHGVARLGAGTRLFALAPAGGGETLVAGEAGAGRHTRLLLARLSASGRLDQRFGRRGIALGPAVRTTQGIGSLGRAIAVQRNGRVVVVGTATSADGSASDGLLVERFMPDGRIDRGFGHGGVVNLLAGSFGQGDAVALGAGGRIIAAGSANAAGSGGSAFPRVAVAELSSRGRPLRGFGSGGVSVLDLGPYSYALAAAVQRGGRIVIAGSRSPGLQATTTLLARLTPGGRLDHSFAGGAGYYARQDALSGGAFSTFDALALGPGGEITTAGAAIAGGERADALLARFSASGRPLGSFGSGGVAYAPAASGYLASAGTGVPGASAVALAPGGGLIAAGEAATGALSEPALWRLDARGRLVRSFGSGGRALLRLPAGTTGEATALTLARGQLLVAGDERLIGRYRGLVARFSLGG
jgi:uncharacterized delta-60 repeat protein